MNDKYEFTGETKEVLGYIVRRIRATVAFAGVAKGELGGWIEKEANLSITGEAWVCGNASVYGNAKVYGDAVVCDNASVSGDASVSDNAVVSDNAKVYGDAQVSGSAVVCGDAVVHDTNDYATFKNFWSSGRWFTYTCSNRKWRVGCFYGTGEELVRKAYNDGEVIGKCYEAIVKAVEAIENATAKETHRTAHEAINKEVRDGE